MCVSCSGNSEVSDLAKEKDLHWEIVKKKWITGAGCIVEDLLWPKKIS